MKPGPLLRADDLTRGFAVRRGWRALLRNGPPEPTALQQYLLGVKR